MDQADKRQRLRHPQALGDLLIYRLGRLYATAGAMTLRVCEGEFGIPRREWRLLAVLGEAGELQPSELATRRAGPRAHLACSHRAAGQGAGGTPRGGQRPSPRARAADRCRPRAARAHAAARSGDQRRDPGPTGRRPRRCAGRPPGQAAAPGDAAAAGKCLAEGRPPSWRAIVSFDGRHHGALGAPSRPAGCGIAWLDRADRPCAQGAEPRVLRPLADTERAQEGGERGGPLHDRSPPGRSADETLRIALSKRAAERLACHSARVNVRRPPDDVCSVLP